MGSLDRVAEAGLVRPTGVPRRFRFRHPIIRQAVYELAGPGWRLAAHGRAAASLAAAKASATAQAHHWERAAKPGDKNAIAILIEAATTAEARAPDAAARWYAAALRLLPADDPASEDLPIRRLMMLLALARALGSAGRLEESHDALVGALELLPSEAASLRVTAVAFTAAVEHLLGRQPRGPRPPAGRARCASRSSVGRRRRAPDRARRRRDLRLRLRRHAGVGGVSPLGRLRPWRCRPHGRSLGAPRIRLVLPRPAGRSGRALELRSPGRRRDGRRSTRRPPRRRLLPGLGRALHGVGRGRRPAPGAWSGAGPVDGTGPPRASHGAGTYRRSSAYPPRTADPLSPLPTTERTHWPWFLKPKSL